MAREIFIVARDGVPVPSDVDHRRIIGYTTREIAVEWGPGGEVVRYLPADALEQISTLLGALLGQKMPAELVDPIAEMRRIAEEALG